MHLNRGRGVCTLHLTPKDAGCKETAAAIDLAGRSRRSALDPRRLVVDVHESPPTGSSPWQRWADLVHRIGTVHECLFVCEKTALYNFSYLQTTRQRRTTYRTVRACGMRSAGSSASALRGGSRCCMTRAPADGPRYCTAGLKKQSSGGVRRCAIWELKGGRPETGLDLHAQYTVAGPNPGVARDAVDNPSRPRSQR